MTWGKYYQGEAWCRPRPRPLTRQATPPLIVSSPARLQNVMSSHPGLVPSWQELRHHHPLSRLHHHPRAFTGTRTCTAKHKDTQALHPCSPSPFAHNHCPQHPLGHPPSSPPLWIVSSSTRYTSHPFSSPLLPALQRQAAATASTRWHLLMHVPSHGLKQRAR